jgi:hypothetical protein
MQVPSSVTDASVTELGPREDQCSLPILFDAETSAHRNTINAQSRPREPSPIVDRLTEWKACLINHSHNLTPGDSLVARNASLPVV